MNQEKEKCKHLNVLPIIRGSFLLGTGDVSTEYYCIKCKRTLKVDEL